VAGFEVPGDTDYTEHFADVQPRSPTERRRQTAEHSSRKRSSIRASIDPRNSTSIRLLGQMLSRRRPEADRRRLPLAAVTPPSRGRPGAPGSFAREPPALDTPATRTSSTLAARPGGSRPLPEAVPVGRARAASAIGALPSFAASGVPHSSRSTSGHSPGGGLLRADWRGYCASAFGAFHRCVSLLNFA